MISPEDVSAIAKSRDPVAEPSYDFRSVLRHLRPLCPVLHEMLVSLLDPLAPVRTLGPIGPGVSVQ